MHVNACTGRGINYTVVHTQECNSDGNHFKNFEGLERLTLSWNETVKGGFQDLKNTLQAERELRLFMGQVTIETKHIDCLSKVKTFLFGVSMSLHSSGCGCKKSRDSLLPVRDHFCSFPFCNLLCKQIRKEG